MSASEVVQESERPSSIVTFAPVTKTGERKSSMFGRMSASPNVSHDKINFGVPSRKSVLAYASAKHSVGSWRVAIHKFFDQKWVQRTLMTLLIFDILFIFAELFLQVEFPLCYIIERDCEACCPEADQSNGRWLSGGASYQPVCPTGYDSTGEAGCDDNKWETVHEIESALFACTVAILVWVHAEVLLIIEWLNCKSRRTVST